ncbi:transporter substrate-binding domain-containing protein [Bosea sp. (in: a-proteobacteria)]|uniref:transporter substrate-binding domain-containing protein n=1 Tax=Bosea sp. (in: a-proteobacteria) TaxID=1871050 RepID=UPI0011F40D1D|nr:transporter substrate-binding domain-containing protein [Bosea sp. (in: a-proteobacteria)]TAJ34107.1 MAG: transporter substrate-binding domain-containing protein [Bosea sp. (in: a-proteobacteria)]
MPTLKSSSRRRFSMVVVGGVAALAATTGLSFAQTAGGSVRTIKIATSAESKPLSWGAIGVEPQGYEPDVLKAINAKLPQYKFEMEGAADIAQETGLVTGKYDIATGGYYKNPARSKQFLIPENPMGASLLKIYSRKGSGINELKDLVGKQIVPLTAGGGTYRYVTQWQTENPQYKIEIAGSNAGVPYPNRLNEIQNKKYDAAILPSNLGQQEVIENQKLDIVASDPILINNTVMLIHRSEKNEALLADVDKALKELKDDGTLSKISVKWFGEDIVKYIK